MINIDFWTLILMAATTNKKTFYVIHYSVQVSNYTQHHYTSLQTYSTTGGT